MADTEITGYLKKIFEAELQREDKFMSQEDIEEVLKEDYTELEARPSIVGYPTRPLYRELECRIQHWLKTKKCPILDLPTYNLLDEKAYTDARQENIASLARPLEGIEALWTLLSEDERIFRIRDILVILGKRGMLDLLGMRKTVGTFDFWPPPRQVLLETFETPNSLPSLLTVGARALAKHCHRDSSSSWWGVSTGREVDKNAHATETATRILNDAHWINIHHLPNDVHAMEVRQRDGYGVRWTSDGQSFRGFLEPQMVDGHAIGWRH